MAVLERQREPADPVLFKVILALLVVGVVAVYDSSYAHSMDLRGMGNDGFYLLKRQALYAAAGLVGMLTMARFGYWRLRKLALPMLVLSIALLFMVWAPYIGMTRNGAARWIDFRIFQLQPSEVAKLTLVVYLAALLSQHRYKIGDFRDGLMAPLAAIGLVALTVEREPDLGTAIIIFLASMTMLYLAGARTKHLVMIGCVSGVVLLLVAGRGFRGGRIDAWLHPDRHPLGRAYQTNHGIIAVGSGGIRGMGIGAGREKFYLPEASTDFIFATIAEETGTWGSMVVIGLLFAASWQGKEIARRTRDKFGKLLAAGIAAMISWQAVINLSVVTGLIPATGVPLPFVSYGGSSLIFLLTGLGILLNVSQHPDAPVREL